MCEVTLKTQVVLCCVLAWQPLLHGNEAFEDVDEVVDEHEEPELWR